MKFCMCCHFLFAVLLLVVTDLTCFCCFQIKLSIQNTCPFNSSWYWFVLSGQNCWRQIVYGLFIDVLQLVCCCFCLIGIHSIQGWRATTRNGVTRKRRRKRSKASKKSLFTGFSIWKTRKFRGYRRVKSRTPPTK